MSDDKATEHSTELSECLAEKTQLRRDIDTLMKIADDWRDVARVIARDWIPVKDLQKAYVDHVFLHIYEKRQDGE
jgi:hypothetical protein